MTRSSWSGLGPLTREHGYVALSRGRISNHIYLATDLYDQHAHTDEIERIEILKVPLAQLDDVIRENKDSKTLVGLLWFKLFQDGAAS